MHDPEDDVQIVWVSGKVNKVPPWALVVGHNLEEQPIMLAIGYVDDEPQRLGHYVNGSSCAEYVKLVEQKQEPRCSSSWKIATVKPCKR